MPMNQSVVRMTLDIRDMESQSSFSVKQNDTMRRLIVTLTDHAKPYIIGENCYALFSAKTSEDTFVSEGCQIVDNKIIYDLSNVASATKGKSDCEITIFGEEGETLATSHFTMMVYASIPGEYAEAVVGSDEFAVLQSLISEVKKALDEIDALPDSYTKKETKDLIDNAINSAITEALNTEVEV